MEEQLISFETAKLAKEKGFDIKCKNWYNQIEDLEPVKGIRGAMCYTNEGYAPTQSLLQKWLREVHKIEIKVELMSDFHNKDQYYPELGYIYNVLCFTKEEDGKVLRDMISSSGGSTYEEALERALQRGLEFIDHPFRRKNKLI